MAGDPAISDAAAKRDGLPILERVRALRAEFALSMTEAKAIIDATDGRPPLLPPVNDSKELTAVLTSELGFCTCASEAATGVLKRLLRVAQDRSDATKDAAAFASVSRVLEDLLSSGGGWAEWLVYGLEQRGFVQHGFRQTDLLISDKGRLLLQALERFDPDYGGIS